MATNDNETDRETLLATIAEGKREPSEREAQGHRSQRDRVLARIAQRERPLPSILIAIPGTASRQPALGH